MNPPPTSGRAGRQIPTIAFWRLSPRTLCLNHISFFSEFQVPCEGRSTSGSKTTATGTTQGKLR